MATTLLEPKDMDWIDKGVLGIEWTDGHKGVYPVRYLRQHCPCAACTDEWTGQLRIKEDDVPLLIMVKDVEPVGRYALRFRWSDGHDTGIYSFAFLRRICQCDICQPVKPEQPKSRRLLSALLVLLAWSILSAWACSLSSLPPLEEQKARILSKQIAFRSLTSQAFLETWGEPTYVHYEATQFFPVKDGNYIPRFRVPLGEFPPGWDSSVVSDQALFLGYADRGELLGFLENRLVYREQMPAEQIHAIASQWKRDEMFKTRLEAPPARPPLP